MQPERDGIPKVMVRAVARALDGQPRGRYRAAPAARPSYLSARRRFDPGAADRLRDYLGSLPLLWLAILIREGMRRANQGALAGWTVNGLPANQRLRRYLARALAWPDLDFADEFAGLAEFTLFPATDVR